MNRTEEMKYPASQYARNRMKIQDEDDAETTEKL